MAKKGTAQLFFQKLGKASEQTTRFLAEYIHITKETRITGPLLPLALLIINS